MGESNPSQHGGPGKVLWRKGDLSQGWKDEWGFSGRKWEFQGKVRARASLGMAATLSVVLTGRTTGAPQ